MFSWVPQMGYNGMKPCHAAVPSMALMGLAPLNPLVVPLARNPPGWESMLHPRMPCRGQQNPALPPVPYQG